MLSTSLEFVSISTPNGEDKPFPVREIQGDFYRLIPSRFPPISLYERVVANDRMAELVEVENITNPRLRSAAQITGGVHPIDPSSPQLQNWNLAPFAYGNPEGTTYFRPGFPCLEMADDLQTALAIAVRRRETFLSRTAEAPIGLDMRVLKTPVNGRFVDLRSLKADDDLKSRWALGDSIVKCDRDGVLFRGRARPSATCIGVLKSMALGRSQQTQHYRFRWDGRRIDALYSFDDAREIVPEDLFGDDTVIPAKNAGAA